MSPVIILKKDKSKWFLFYVNTAQNKNSAADGALIVSLVTPSCVVLRSVTVGGCGLQF